MAVSPDSRDLYVTNAELGLATRADTEALTIDQTTELAPFLPTGETHAAVGPDGTLFVAADYTVRVHDRGSLAVTDEWITEQVIAGLDVSPDGDELFVAQIGSTAPAAVEVVDTSTGDPVRDLQPDLGADVVGLGRQRVPLPYGSKECAY
jgi:DNA-binding beta-propeller fold protein YncE